MPDSYGRPTMADIDNDVILAAIRGYKHFDLGNPTDQLHRFYPRKLVLAKMERLASAGLVEYGCGVASAWIVDDVKQPPCGQCGSTDAWLVLDPFLQDVHEELHVVALCVGCRQDRQDEI